jgi:hypothetical protein
VAVDRGDQGQPLGGGRLGVLAQPADVAAPPQCAGGQAALPGLRDEPLQQAVRLDLPQPPAAVGDEHRGRLLLDGEGRTGPEEAVLEGLDVLHDADDAVGVVPAQVGIDQAAGHAVGLGVRHAGGGEEGVGEGKERLGRQGRHGRSPSGGRIRPRGRSTIPEARSRGEGKIDREEPDTFFLARRPPGGYISTGEFSRNHPFCDRRGSPMRLVRQPFPAALAILATFLAAGCSPPDSTEQARARAEIDALRAEVQKLKAETEAARAELDAWKLRAPGGVPRPDAKPDAKVEPQDFNLAQRFLNLKGLYDKNAIDSAEYSRLKQKVIDEVPAALPPGETRTLGQRFLDLRGAYDKNAIDSGEWSRAKARLIAQGPAAGPGKFQTLEKELLDLKTAYDRNAIDSGEWSRAKAELEKKVK